MNTYKTQTLDNCRKSLILFFLIPIILIGFIYINYGDIIEVIIRRQNIMSELFQLKTHLSIFQEKITTIPEKSLPIVVSTIGYYSLISIYFLFLGWLILFVFSSYLKLSQRMNQELIILFETVILSAIYIFSIIPGLVLWLTILGGLFLISVVIMLFLYWNYNRLIRNEKR